MSVVVARGKLGTLHYLYFSLAGIKNEIDVFYYIVRYESTLFSATLESGKIVEVFGYVNIFVIIKNHVIYVGWLLFVQFW